MADTVTPHTGDSFTPHYHLNQPEDGGSNGTWGPKLNTDMLTIDTTMFNNATAIAAVQGQVSANTLTLTRSPAANAAVSLVNNSAAGGQTQRWFIYMDNAAEGGGNAASDLRFNAYSDTGAYLQTPLQVTRASGTVTIGSGGLSMQGNLLGHNIYPSYAAATQWVQFVQGGWYTTQYISGWWDGWNSSGGARSWFSPNGQIMNCDGAGNMNLMGSIAVGGNVSCGGSAALLGGNATYPCYATANNWYFTVSGASRAHSWGPGWSDQWRTSDGMRFWYVGSGQAMTFDGSCNLTTPGGVFAGQVSASGNNFAHSAFYCDNQSGGFFHRAANGTMAMQIYCNTDNNVATWVNNRTGANLQQDQNGWFIANCGGAAWKLNGGPWLTLSDSRIKEVIGAYKAGLKEVLRLNPVEFIYKGNDTPHEHLGGLKEQSPDHKAEERGIPHDGPAPFPASPHYKSAAKREKLVGYVADDIMEVLPETVGRMKGWIDGKEVDDLKYLDTANVVHALVNAVKELYAEVQALKAARA